MSTFKLHKHVPLLVFYFHFYVTHFNLSIVPFSVSKKLSCTIDVPEVLIILIFVVKNCVKNQFLSLPYKYQIQILPCITQNGTYEERGVTFTKYT